MVEHTRTLGFWVAYAIGLGTMIAAGIFSLSGTAVAQIGSSAVIAFIIAALVAGLTAASYSEFASIYSENGGGYLFSSRTFDHDLLTYTVGVLLFLGYTGTTAFYLATMDEWFVKFIIPHGWPIPHGAVGVVAAVMLGALNAKGTEESGTFQVLVTGAKVAVLIAFIGGAMNYAGPTTAVGDFAVSFQIEPINIVSIAALAFITFFGFSAIAASAGEIINPRETVPKAIAASIVTVTILYTFVIVAMVNTPQTIGGQPRAEVLQAGETAMGTVAAAFLGPLGQSLIVAGAVFSMVSASNASILAASGIGSLMGQRGQAPRPFSRIHPEFGTPTWSVSTATATIVGFIVAFITIFPADGGLAGIDLGLTALTGFATFNLLVPLSIVNAALIYSRRRYPDLDRPFTVPLVPFLPVIGIVANLALITNLPFRGVVVGVVVAIALVAAYLSWGGEPEQSELAQRVTGPQAILERNPSQTELAETADEYRVLVPVARPSEAAKHVHVAESIAQAMTDEDESPFLQVVNVTQVPDQTPYETLTETAEDRVTDLTDRIESADLDVPHTVEGHLSKDVAFDIVQTARDDGADLVVMGYPKEHRSVVEDIQFKAPCDVVYTSGFDVDESFDTITVGAGGGPHHWAMVPVVAAFAQQGSAVNVVHVDPSGGEGTAEVVQETIDALDDVDVEVHNVQRDSVTDGLLDVASSVGGPLFVGATRDRGMKRWFLGSVPDHVIAGADDRDIPVLVYTAETGVPGRLREAAFPLYRYFLKRTRG